MFSYEIKAVKKIAGAVHRAVSASTRFVSAQVQDAAVRRAAILGGAAVLVRKLPFLTQDVAERLSTEILFGLGILLSKLPGTQELLARAEITKAAAGTAPAAPATEEVP